MRCPDCQKFASLETQEPEVNDLEVSESGNDGNVTLTGNVRLVRTCADCGTEMKEANFDFEQEATIDGWQTGDKLEDLKVIEDGGAEMTESGGGRYKKNMIGYKLNLSVSGNIVRGKKKIEFTQVETIEDAMQASAFDEMV